MSLYGALFAGVAGLNAQSNKLGVISDNVANVNTVGYKEASAQFATLVVGAGATTAYSPGGVLGSSSQLVSTQGLLTTTSSPTDIAISGNGFFVVNQKADQSGQVLFTRAGSFIQDSSGNFTNSSGLFLQAWPLDRNGDLPGAVGNLDTTSSANLNSLKTVNVENVTGSASPTTNISLGANLNAGQAAYPGAGATATPDVSDPSNTGISASSLIVPSTVDNLTRGDKFTVTTSSNQTFPFTYGGLTKGRDASSGAVGDSGNTLATGGPLTLNTTAVTPTALATHAVGSARIDVTADTTNLHTGDTVTIAGAAAFDNFGAPDLNQTCTIVVDTVGGAGVGKFHYTAGLTSASGNVAGVGAPVSSGVALGTATPSPITTTSGSSDIIITQPGNNLAVGDVVTISGVTAPGNNLNGIPTIAINTNFVVKSVNADGIHFTVTTTGTAGATTSGATGTIKSNVRPFIGNILDATNASTAFLSTTTTSPFLPTALSFTITTGATGPVKFTYTPTAPNAALGQFNNMNNLADAINATGGLTARVVTVNSASRLYVGATDANAQVTFADGASVGSGAPGSALAPIHWISELGLSTVSLGAGRYNSLNSLASLVNSSSSSPGGLTATVSDPTGTSSLKINLIDPLGTIKFSDATYGGLNNTGSPLAALGLISSLASVAPTSGPGTSTAVLGPAYDPTNSAKNMASGAVASQFSRPITIYDSLGTSHTINVAFLKTSNKVWQVEVFAQPASDVSTSLPNGQIASGSIQFNGDGSLQSVSPGLIPSGGIIVNWTNGASASALNYNVGTAGRQFGSSGTGTIGKTDGLSQFNSDYNVNFANQNGAPVGQLTGISIDANGYIIASYSNGETSKLYKIPLGQFTNPNDLQTASGDAFTQTTGSGVVNLKQAGSSGVGTITSGALEASNVELASQLTDMIVAQRAYQANTKVIQAADSLLNSLDQIIQ